MAAARFLRALELAYAQSLGRVPRRQLARAEGGLKRLALLRDRALPYDDRTATFSGGDVAPMIRRNYEKSLANLWKAEVVAPFLGFQDASGEERRRRAAASSPDPVTREAAEEIDGLTDAIDSKGFERTLRQHYSPRERRALAQLLSVICHGEAYALFVSASLLPVVNGTGPKLGMAMQVMEEAKHFIVMRTLVRKIEQIHPQVVWDFVLLEEILRAAPMDRLFGMNVVVESIAMNFFGAFSSYPGLERVLPRFHLDESRHSAFPVSYAEEGGLDTREVNSLAARRRRLQLILPLIPLLIHLEPAARAVGMDIFEFGGFAFEKVVRLAGRAGYLLPFSPRDVLRIYNVGVNLGCRIMDPGRYEAVHDFTRPRTYRASREIRRIEAEVFGEGASSEELRDWEGLVGRALQPFKDAAYRGAMGLVRGSLAPAPA